MVRGQDGSIHKREQDIRPLRFLTIHLEGRGVSLSYQEGHAEGVTLRYPWTFTAHDTINCTKPGNTQDYVDSVYLFRQSKITIVVLTIKDMWFSCEHVSYYFEYFFNNVGRGRVKLSETFP